MEKEKVLMVKIICRIIGVFLIFICLSFVLAHTYGWKNANQQSKNEAMGEAREFEVQLLKLERSPSGIITEKPVPGATFYLFTENGVQIGGRYVINDEGKTVVQLEKGNYYFEEFAPAFGYEFDSENGQPKTKYPFSIVGDETNYVFVRAYNVPSVGSLSIEKILKNSDNSALTEEQKNMEFTYIVTFSDDGVYSYRINKGPEQKLKSGGKLTLKHGEIAVFENIPTGVLYNVKELPNSMYIIKGSGHQGNITKEDSKATFENTIDKDKIGSLKVTKEVQGAGADLNKEFKFTAVINGKTETFVLKHGENKVFKNIPVGSDYKVTETDYSKDGYFTTIDSFDGKIQSSQELELPFVNIYKTDPDISNKFGDLNILKEVVGDNADPNKEFTFEITFEGNGAPASPQTFKLKAGETKTFKDIPHGVTYKVREVDSAGYLPLTEEINGTIVGEESISVAFKNRVPDKPKEDAKIRVNKVLKAGETDVMAYKFSLIVDGKESKFTIKPNEKKEFNVPAGSYYEIREDDYYGEGYSQYIVNGIGNVLPGEVVEVSIINTFVGEVYIDIAGEKTWDTGSAGNVSLPESITVKLLRDNLTYEEMEVKPDANGKWIYNFTVPKYDVNGKEIKYSIEEVKLKDFTPSYDGFNIKNTYTPSQEPPVIEEPDKPVLVDPPIIRKIVKGDKAPNTRFDFIMKGEHGAPMPKGSDGNTKIITLNKGYTELGEIAFTKPGTYVYTVTERKGIVSGWTYDEASYILTVNVTQKDGKLVAERTLTKNGAKASVIEFTNRYDASKLSEKVVISGTKTWQHGNNPADKHPSSVTVQIFGDGEMVDQIDVTENDGWSYSFNVPKYAEDGHEIIYTIDEAKVSSYEKVIDGYNITNIYKADDTSFSTDDNDGSSAGINMQDPQTGDKNRSGLFIILSAVSGLMMIFIITLRNKKNNENLRK